MTPGVFAQYLSERTPFRLAHIEFVMRKARKHGLLPVKGRGPISSLQIKTEHASIVMAALTVECVFLIRGGKRWCASTKNIADIIKNRLKKRRAFTFALCSQHGVLVGVEFPVAVMRDIARTVA